MEGSEGERGKEGREEVEKEEEATGRRSSVVCSCLRFVSPLLEIFRGETQKKHACTQIHTHTPMCVLSTHTHARKGVRF